QHMFASISNIIQEQKMNKTTMQVNLLDIYSKPSETNVNMTLYDVKRNEYKYNYIHTLNYQNNPDTLYVDEYTTYKVIAHTIPQTDSKEVKWSGGKQSIVSMDAPQGYLTVTRSE